MSASTTNLKTFGRAHRDVPYYGFLKVRLYPKRHKILADDLAEWCGERYLTVNSRAGIKQAYRIGTYTHSNGKKYVDRVYLGDLSASDLFELQLRHGDFVEDKVERNGNLRRPRLNKEEKAERDAIINAFYTDVARKRMAKAEEELSESAVNNVISSRKVT